MGVVSEFWQFAGNYWWLIFPIMGMSAGAFNAWQRGAKARHERKLEMMRVKNELRAARGTAPAKREPEESQQTQLERLLATHDDVTHRWLDYELDVAKLIAFPAMSDGRQPLTAAFLRAQRVADRLRPASAKVRLTPAEFAEYRDAVTDYEVAFDLAERDARRVKDSSFSDAERKRLDKAKQLLTVAIDQAATPAERQLAYRRVREELDGLLLLSDGAIDELEKKVSLELTSGQATDVATAAPPAAAAPPTPATSPTPEPLPHTSAPRVPPPSTTAPGRVIRPRAER